MIRHTPDFDQRIADWLEADPSTAPADVLSTVVAALPSIPQGRRALLAPWRFTQMTNFARAAAGVAIVAIVGVGVLALNFRPSGPAGPGTPAPTAPLTPTATVAAPSTLPPGIPGWTPYASGVYGFTMAYPSDWSVHEPASQQWPAGQGLPDSVPYADSFSDPAADIGLWVWQMAAPAGANVGSTAGMGAAFSALCAGIGAESCEPVFAPKVLCLSPLGLREPPSDRERCSAALFAPIGSVDEEIPHAFVGDPETNVVTVFVIGREDSFPAAAKYGGTEALLMAIVSQLGVR